MASERLAGQIRAIPARFINVFIEASLGASALLTPSTAGGSFAFLDRHIEFLTIPMIGGLFIILALLTILTTDKRLYFVIAFIFAAVAVAALWGALLGEVSYQASILWLGVALYNLWAFPESNGNEY